MWIEGCINDAGYTSRRSRLSNLPVAETNVRVSRVPAILAIQRKHEASRLCLISLHPSSLRRVVFLIAIPYWNFTPLADRGSLPDPTSRVPALRITSPIPYRSKENELVPPQPRRGVLVALVRALSLSIHKLGEGHVILSIWDNSES